MAHGAERSAGCRSFQRPSQTSIEHWYRMCIVRPPLRLLDERNDKKRFFFAAGLPRSVLVAGTEFLWKQKGLPKYA